MSDLKEQYEEALDLWRKITGVQYDASVYRGFDEIEIHRLNEAVRDAAAKEGSGLLAFMLLRKYSQSYFKSIKYTFADILAFDESLQGKLNNSKRLNEILFSDDLNRFAEEFKQNTLKALEWYGVEDEETFAYAEDINELTQLWYDAVKSMGSLTIRQLRRGKKVDTPFKYANFIFQFKNMAELMQVIPTTDAGIALCMILDNEEVAASYFAFLVWNGENVYILTDEPNYKHPFQKFMTRRPDRRMDSRSEKHHFPYGFFSQYGKFEENLVDVSDYTAIDVFSNMGSDVAEKGIHCRPLVSLSKMDANIIIWLSMLFPMIDEHFKRGVLDKSELSYAGSEFVPQLMANAAETALVPARQLELDRIKNEDICGDNILSFCDTPPVGRNAWLEKRYEGAVSEDYLNVVGGKILTEDGLLCLPAPGELEISTNNLASFETDCVGTVAEIRKTRLYLARMNKATIIDKMAQKEYAEREKGVMAWYKQRVKDNLPVLYRAAVTGIFITPGQVYKSENSFRYGDRDVEEVNILRVRKITNDYWASCMDATFDCKPNDQRGNYYRCAITGAVGVVAAIFQPTTAEGLARLCGVTVNELPDVLQQFKHSEAYYGNSILNAVDPMEWQIKDPWNRMDFDVIIFLSKRAWVRLQKEQGIPVNKFWETEDYMSVKDVKEQNRPVIFRIGE